MDLTQEAKQSRMQKTLETEKERLLSFDRRERQLPMVKKCYEDGRRGKNTSSRRSQKETFLETRNKIQRGGETDHNLWALKVKRLSSH